MKVKDLVFAARKTGPKPGIPLRSLKRVALGGRKGNLLVWTAWLLSGKTGKSYRDVSSVWVKTLTLTQLSRIELSAKGSFSGGPGVPGCLRR